MSCHADKFRIFTGNSNKGLAKSICTEMEKVYRRKHPEDYSELAEDIPVHLGDVRVGLFSDGEISVKLEDSVRGANVFVIQSTCSPVNRNLMELLIMIDAMKRASARRITAVIPYFGYARQDRKADRRDPITAKLVANMIATAGAARVLTMDLHASQIQGFFDIPVDNLSGAAIFINYYKKKFDLSREEMVVVSPDVGSVARARKVAEQLGMGLAIVDKRRPRPNESQVMNVIGDVQGRDCILFDDMVDTAGSLVHAAEALVDIGKAASVHACASHGILSGPALQRINDSPIQELALLETIPPINPSDCPKIHYLSSAPMFAEAIDLVFRDAPFSEMESPGHSFR